MTPPLTWLEHSDFGSTADWPQTEHWNKRIVGQSPAYLWVMSLMKKVAPTTITVLIQGETGTGKGLFAQKIHELSSRGTRKMVVVNCGALPEGIFHYIQRKYHQIERWVEVAK